MSDNDANSSANDIAVIGMALRVPGALSPEEFWSNLRNGVESIGDLTSEELLAAGESPDLMRRKNYVPRAAKLGGYDTFDAEFFGFSPKEAAVMDPQHRQFLECAWEAFENGARLPENLAGPVGVFAGCGMGSYFYFNVCSHRALVEKDGMFLLRHTGNDKDFMATRASYLFDLHGPSINVQTACSTSLVAVHYACQSLLNRECEMAIAGGVTIELPQGRGYLFQDGEILSTDGHCRAFDHRASGTVFGSGTGVVVLRRLEDALADGDPIHAVIKATAINNDGAAKAGYLAPSVTGQAEAIVEAQALAGVDADTIGYVECHGTGTYLGDPIEIEALTQAFRQTTDKRGFCRVGSVKSNIGHLDTAAGVVSLIKAILAVKHGEMPPTLGFEKPNPSIDFANSPFVVNDRLTPWPEGPAPRRAGVNSLGVGGTNAHAVIEEAPRQPAAVRRDAESPQLLMTSAKSRKALDDAGARLAAHIAAHPEQSLADIAYTLFEGRKHFDYRRVVAVTDKADAVACLTSTTHQRPQTHTAVAGDVTGKPEAVFLFPGGGSQYPHMARALYRDEPAFARIVDEGLSYLPAAVSDEIRSIWLAKDGPTTDAAIRLLRPSLQLPAILIVEVALARLWISWGVKPAALIGHSMGENAAACVSGVLSFKNAINLVYLRGTLFEEVPPGGMVSVGLSYDALKARLPERLDVASVNAPELCVVSGPNDALDSFRETLVAEGIDASRIPIDIAAHSRMLIPILDRFRAFLSSIQLSAPTIPIVANRTGQWLTAAEARDPGYWTSHLRSTIHYADGVSFLAENPARVYIEVGPGRVLGSLVKAHGIPANQVINSLPHPDEGSDDRLHFLTALGRAWATGLDVTLNKFWSAANPRRVSLPTYPFQHQRYFLDRIENAAVERQNATPTKIPDIANWGWQPTWKQSAPDVDLTAAERAASWLIFLDDGNVGRTLADKLRAHGHTVTTVSLGDKFGVADDGNFVVCPEHGREGYDQLLQSLRDTNRLPERIVHLWLLTHDESFRPGSSFFHRNQERGFYSLFFLGQALSDVEISEPIQLTVVTNGMMRVRKEAAPYPDKATVLGPAQVIPRELTNVSVRVVDIAMPVSAPEGFILRQKTRLANILSSASTDGAQLDWLWDEILASNGNEIVAHRNERRWTRTTQPLPLPEPTKDIPFRERGVYLITGGLGELGLACARHLAQTFKARLVLIGRTRLPDRAEWQSYIASYGTQDRIGRIISAAQDIEQAGGEVLLSQADITNPESVSAVIRAAIVRFGAINGVLHAAGTVKDNLIPLKTTEEIEDVFAPKVLGTQVLANALADTPLDLMVLFSSTSTDTTPAGQVDYVAANAFLNAFADSRADNPTTRTVAIHWGVWKNVGLAARAIERAETNTADLTVETIDAPLFDRRLKDAQGNEWLEARLDGARQWILDEHRLKNGEAVLPGTGFIELIAEALTETHVFGPVEIENLTFLQPLHVPESETRSVRVTLTPDGDAYATAIETEPATGTNGGLILHANAQIRTRLSEQPHPVDLAALRGACGEATSNADGSAMRSAQDPHLRFGPRWQVLRSLSIGPGGAMAHLALDDAFNADLQQGYLVHPALLDIATGYAMALIPGYDPARGLWVPMSYGRIRLYGSLPAEIWSHVRLNTTSDFGPGYATFDVTICDTNGRVLIDVEGFTIKHIGTTIDLAAAATGTRASGSQSSTTDLSPALAQLAAQVDQGILPDEGGDALVRAVATGKSQVIVSSMDLGELKAAAQRVHVEAADTAGFERPDLGVAFAEPETETERTLAGFWSELLGVQNIGINDNFFDLGGHSLIAVRLFRMIKKAFDIEFPISVLFQAPTIAQCAELIEAAGGKSKDDKTSGPEKPSNVSVLPTLQHLVRMDRGRHVGRTPFFICAGMFGNILNLRHLALQIGNDRPVYGLQARGIYGGQAPHETFQEMAAANIAEMRTIQPHGPYLIGGFSGGGLVAYEMAQQLRAMGETTSIVVLLDTPYPDDPVLSVSDRLLMKWQDFQREGTSFVSNWLRNKLAWKQRLRQSQDALVARTSDQLHNEEIEAAFRRALGRYRGEAYTAPVLLMRPKLEVSYRITGNRELNHERSLLRSDNGWTPFASDLTIIEVPGDHDGMVLEPYVRVMAGHLRSALKTADRAGAALMLAAS